MVRTIFAVAILGGAPAFAYAESAAAPLIVTATVVSTCSVDVPRSAEASIFGTFPISVTCAKGKTTPRVQRPVAPRRRDVRDAVLIIDF